MNKFAIIALDGLGLQELDRLAEFSTFLAGIRRNYVFAQTESNILSNTATGWATLLTALDWPDHTCSGFAKPVRSLLNLQVVDERQLPQKSLRLLGQTASRETMLINIPLVLPGDRIWLSDGTVPVQTRFSPELLSKKHPEINSYQPCGWLNCNKPPVELLREAISTEILRLQLAADLTQSQRPALSVVRAAIFDVAGHLIGPQFYSRKFQVELSSIGHALDALAHALKCADMIVLMISSYSFENCLQVVNLNHLLAGGGFCRMSPHSRTARMIALEGLGNRHARWTIVPSKSSAYSPTHGTVYLNRKSRYDDGTVCESQSSSLAETILNYLTTVCEQRYGLDFSGKTYPQSDLPDVAFRLRGADYTCSDNADPFDRPAGVHCPRGFLAFPPGLRNLDKEMGLCTAGQKLCQAVEG